MLPGVPAQEAQRLQLAAQFQIEFAQSTGNSHTGRAGLPGGSTAIGKDQHIKPENVQKVTEALDATGKDYINVVISYADHAFACDERPNYNATATKEALALTLTFLNE